ncbi:MAG: hypothetical protein JXB49_29180 [Bacteroidales bacterium]|nr:hypothetical protein [Bacteroidales bacterium]
MKEEFDAYILFNKPDDASNTRLVGWENDIVKHLTVILQRLKKKTAVIDANINNDEDNNITSIASQYACIIIQSPGAIENLDPTIATELLSQNKIIKLTTSSSTAENTLQDAPEIILYDVNSDKNNPTLLSASSPANQAIYWQKLTDLAYEVKNIIDLQSKKPSNEKPGIFLADTSIDQQYNRDIIQRELSQYGFRIFPEKPLPSEYEKLKVELNSILDNTRLSIHIIGNQYNNILKDADISKTEAQNKIASEYYENKVKKNLSRLIWISPELKIKDPRQEKFIASLSKDPKELFGGEIIQTPLEVLKTIINRNLRENQIDIAKKGPQKSIYIIHDINEHESIKPLVKELETTSIHVITSLADKKDVNSVQLHRQNLVNAEGVIIYYNSINPFWLSSKLSDIMKAPGYGKTRPFAAKAIISGSKAKNININTNSNIQVIEQKDESWKKNLESFVNQIHTIKYE